MTSDYDHEKTLEVLLILADSVPKFDQYKACKIIFLADKRHLVRFGRTITGDDYDALEHGPIPSRTRDRIKKFLEKESADGDLASAFKLSRTFRYPRLVAQRQPDFDYLSESDRHVLAEIVAEFGAKGFDELKALTHEMPAYKNAWKEGAISKSFRMSFLDFFEQDEDAVEGVLEDVKENLQLCHSFAS